MVLLGYYWDTAKYSQSCLQNSSVLPKVFEFEVRHQSLSPSVANVFIGAYLTISSGFDRLLNGFLANYDLVSYLESISESCCQAEHYLSTVVVPSRILPLKL